MLDDIDPLVLILGQILSHAFPECIPFLFVIHVGSCLLLNWCVVRGVFRVYDFTFLEMEQLPVGVVEQNRLKRVKSVNHVQKLDDV